ncbi:Aldehyde Dehydrogenase [Emticicia oligotrophica DSM 17448]|uniref:Aldehyde Dehydrogenase n=1 Tax=Emticicia oligotrophica (strain DSM 17448 / CIP 109782 / MTCC 6937 / GPTSA100-15) TaxID=929562 RepID=A0ABM5N0K6_EMTOG|nr:aldehyde dehydrogenase (NADP(+)) [Emticicia oligotrophica]AFK02935.1 Aldehyde Dehydrogenase [Emticicia oligotrophica DSM 17448]
MQITGRNIIGFETFSEGTVAIQAINPATGETLAPLFYKATIQELNLATEKAEKAFQIYRKTSGKKKAEFLEKIAEEIENLGDLLTERYIAESGLPQGRAVGERGRTTGQLRLFAQLLKEGSWVNARIDTALPDRQPLPRPDIRSVERAIGVVGVFGASNFPLAFSVAGGDTASALAAGCPVIFKAHPAHLGTSELVGKAIQKAAEATGMPDGVFSLLFDDGHEIGLALVTHPAIKAVGFTGSYRGGKALFDAAAARPEPIPVYAEMGSVNPVFVLPRILEANGASIAQNFINSVTLGVGQFCTNPGMLLIEKNDAFIETLEHHTSNSQGGVMLTSGIRDAYVRGIEHAKNYTKVIGVGKASDGFTAVEPVFFHTNIEEFIQNPHLSEEIFGPTSLVVEANSKDEILAAAQSMTGHLTATVHGTPEDLEEYAELIEILEQKVGRILINGFPTGVEVSHAMVHGGPFPATTDSRSTSVGTMAITRFTRPVCYQNFPDSLLIDELKESNPLEIWRLVDGELKK